MTLKMFSGGKYYFDHVKFVIQVSKIVNLMDNST